MQQKAKAGKAMLCVCGGYVPHQETRRQVGARVCVERVVQSAQGGALSQGASKLHPEAHPFLRCAENQTPLMRSVTTLLPL